MVFPGQGSDSSRPETGVAQYGKDWPGVFLRGDDAFAFAIVVEWAAAVIEESFGCDTEAYISAQQLRGLASTLKSCRVV